MPLPEGQRDLGRDVGRRIERDQNYQHRPEPAPLLDEIGPTSGQHIPDADRIAGEPDGAAGPARLRTPIHSVKGRTTPPPATRPRATMTARSRRRTAPRQTNRTPPDCPWRRRTAAAARKEAHEQRSRQRRSCSGRAQRKQRRENADRNAARIAKQQSATKTSRTTAPPRNAASMRDTVRSLECQVEFSKSACRGTALAARAPITRCEAVDTDTNRTEAEGSALCADDPSLIGA